MTIALRKTSKRSEYGNRPDEGLLRDASMVCEAPDWGWLIPRVHRALASPGSLTVFPRWKRDSRDADLSRFAYWEAAHYVVHMLLGWREPAKGLAWLADEGREDDDARLGLLTQVWDSSHQMELLLAWYAADYREHGWYAVAPPCRTAAAPTFRMPDQWWREFRQRWHAAGENLYLLGPYGGGTNGLHLNHSIHGACSASSTENAPRVHHDVATRRAVVVLDQMQGWYRALDGAATQLPALRGRSWHVDVFVRPVGWLGTFRQSRATGLWFQGRHSVHMAGNFDPRDDVSAPKV